MAFRNLISSKTGEWMAVIGLEIHAQITSQSKLFSESTVQFMAPPNKLVSHFDASLPGTLPVLNRYCVEAGILTALALSCHVNRRSLFDRKHYFYADLPTGYQITQQRMPIAIEGHLTFNLFDGHCRDRLRQHRVNIKQIQLEQDSGKSLHDDLNHETLVDLNRAGVGLMELVTEPDMTSSSEAAAFVLELQSILKRIGVCDCKMAEGSLRVDANISVNRPGEPRGVRTEVKNINSVRFVKNAIDYEIGRQIDVLEAGDLVVMETRSLDDAGCTVAMRDKEVVLDYRFMPEPNLPPLILYDDETISAAPDVDSAVNISNIRRRLPELPEEQRQRLTIQYGITYSNAMRLLNEEGLADVFEELYSQTTTKDAKKLADWCLIDIMGCLHERNMTAQNCPVPASYLSDVFNHLTSGGISTKSSCQILQIMFNGDSRTVSQIIDEENMRQISSSEEIRRLCKEVIKEQPQMVEIYCTTNKKVMNRMMGMLQQKTHGRVNPKIAKKIIEQLLER